MNALAISSLALALEAAQGTPCLFADLALKSPREDARLLVSSGHAAPGIGAGTYVCDAHCTPGLLAAHPRFVVRTVNGRIFRLRPESGAITPEQGGAAGDGVTDDQPAIQAAIDYAEAVGTQEVRFPAPRYRIDCPLRTSPADRSLASDGHPIVIRKSLVLKGMSAGRTVLDFRALDGASAESDWQLVPTSASDPTLAVWRGGGIFVSGDTLDPGKGQRTVARLELDRLVLRGNRQHTSNHAWPADPVTGDGWDITDKALWVQDCHVGEIVCRDTDMIGWKGEIFYLGGAIDAVERVELARCRFATTNGSAFNPGCNAEILATDCSFGDAFQAQEETGKSRAIYRNCVWHDCDHTTLGSGSTAALLYNWVWPTRDETLPPPLTLLDNCEFRDVGWLRVLSWVSGSIRTVDTPVGLPGSEGQAIRDVDLGIDALLDRKTNIHVLGFYGLEALDEQVPGAPAGVFKRPPANVALRVSHRRTNAAREAGREWLGVNWTGLVDASCSIHAQGEYASGRVPNGGDAPVSMPFVTFGPGSPSTSYWARGWYAVPAFSGPGEIKVTAPLMAVTLADAIIADMTLSRLPSGGSSFGYAEGQTVRISKVGAAGSFRFGKGASASFAVTETRSLVNECDWIEFTYNRERQRWEESGFFSDA